VLSIYVDEDIFKGFFFTLLFPVGVVIAIILVQYTFLSSKPLFNYLYPLALEEVNIEDGLAIKITPLPKEKDFIKDGAIFPLGTNRTIRYILKLNDSYGTEMEIRDVYIVTQSNNSRYVYIDGLYYILKIDSRLSFQLRKRGKPRLKKGMQNRIHTRDDLKEYSEDGKAIPDIYYKLYDLLSIEGMQVYISCTKKALHVGMHGFFKYRKMKEINQNSFEGLKDYLRKLVKIGEKIHEMIDQD